MSSINPTSSGNQTEYNSQWAVYLRAIHHEVLPALGCTEPISLALASAIAGSYLFDDTTPISTKLGQITSINGKVSANLMKNGMGVSVPGTGMVGLPIAAAVGALGGDPKGGLEVLKGLNDEIVTAGKYLLETNRVNVAIKPVANILYSEVTIVASEDSVTVAIADSHTQVIKIEKNKEVLFELKLDETIDNTAPYCLREATVKSIYEFAHNVPFEQIEFILQAEALNNALSEEGMKHNYGLHIGRTLKAQIETGLLSDDLLSNILIRSTAASDARMGGATLPAMSNSGSGNQGISATMPVVVVADHLKATAEQRARALILSHLIAVYIHSKLPKLSAMCAVSTAAMGSAAGMAWLLGKGEYQPISLALSSMVGDIAGIICDGASNSCAMKVSTSASSAFKAVLMAISSSGVTGNEGIVSHDVDQSIENLCSLARGSMQQTDVQIIEIMVKKDNC
ncbi:serine dehydratase subunit alpha family protein [Thorsellia anophelis]|uniref:UPF0597 protein SAMN02583745_00902 n=1 Tax=Thorsellia anophelis DSM 18579 TaxID=1123402 RepID=A0A1I0AD93_9GAMM|nr:L-serine ammonia-lyase, iron-sulfur-dependent, subunit alpha [Thorsellia anophelis]SES92151.1 L-cysteine desulfidase [Thorsellia anophelis DSM 18579]